jgi:2-amino-4-hydroxy-6-hydroxymethyldihydropteridine diphosphokinase
MRDCEETLILLSIGSNLGSREDYIFSAVKMIEESGLVYDLKMSSFYESEPVGFENQPWFLNVSLSGKTELTAYQLLYFVKSIEYLCGRQKRQRWHERELDVDVIFYGNHILNQTNYILPHPAFSKRKFVLMPSAEIAGDTHDPISNKTINTLLNECIDKSVVKLFIPRTT